LTNREGYLIEKPINLGYNSIYINEDFDMELYKQQKLVKKAKKMARNKAMDEGFSKKQASALVKRAVKNIKSK
jgi:hypothetical protein